MTYWFLAILGNELTIQSAFNCKSIMASLQVVYLNRSDQSTQGIDIWLHAWSVWPQTPLIRRQHNSIQFDWCRWWYSADIIMANEDYVEMLVEVQTSGCDMLLFTIRTNLNKSCGKVGKKHRVQDFNVHASVLETIWCNTRSEKEERKKKLGFWGDKNEFGL